MYEVAGTRYQVPGCTSKHTPEAGVPGTKGVAVKDGFYYEENKAKILFYLNLQVGCYWHALPNIYHRKRKYLVLQSITR